MSKRIKKALNDHAIAWKQLSREYDITYDSIVDEALELLEWAIHEKQDGRRICSVEARTIRDNCLITEFANNNGYMYESPLLSKLWGDTYHRPFEVYKPPLRRKR